MTPDFILKINSDLELRLLKLKYTKELFAQVDKNRLYLKTWLPWLNTSNSVNDLKVYIKQVLKNFKQNRNLPLIIWHQEQLIGSITLHGVDWVNKSTSIGYWLAEDQQGQGIMTSSVRALINYCFNSLNLNRVEIRIAPGNLKSQAIPKALGFQQEGLVRSVEWLYDHYVDHLIFGLLKKDWI